MSKREIKTRESLKRFIQEYIDERLVNKDNEDDDDDKLLLDDSVDNDTDKDEEMMQDGDIETGDVIEKLNTIRSGRSFRDSSVKDELEEYVDQLDTAEKTALFALLKGIAQIVTKEIDADDATEPSDPDPDVKMKKTNADSREEKSHGGARKVVKPKIVSNHEEESTPIKPIEK